MAFFDWLRRRLGGGDERVPGRRVRSAPRTLEEVAALVEREGLKERWVDIQRLVRPCVYLELEACDPVTVTAEHSFLGGGFASLRRGEEWPAVDGRPLDPLARIRLSEAAAHDRDGMLPRSGALTFWYSIEEQPWGGSAEDARYVRVTFTPQDAPLERRELPGAAAGKEGKRPPLR
ncbi:MAG TPA: DUF1963 domain-containing protein [Phycisphaerales bacterium]|nr:DUF1963 domain-containing protein [Phycisphaerales bacterium]